MVIAETETKKPHVAVLPSPGMGHIIPLLELAKTLVVNHGIRVSFLNITTEASAAHNQLLHSPNFPPGLHIIDLPAVDISALVRDDTPVLTRLCINVQESLRPLKSVLIELGKLQALFIDLFCTQAFEICKELSIPTYTFSTPSTALFALCLYLPTLDKEVESEFVDLPEPVQVPGCTPVRPEDLLDQVRNRKIDEYKWFLLHVSRLPMAAGIFLNSWEEFEPTSLRAIREHPFYKQIPTPPIHTVGPLINQDKQNLTDLEDECLAWLDKQPSDSVVLIALGSGGTLTTVQLTELAYGLELSQQRFIMVARKPSDASASATFFNVGGDFKVNDPNAYLPKGFLKRTKEVGLVVPTWAPQVAVLRHPSTGAFVSHCGWNSTLESMTHGVPMITWPLYTEQRMNATMLAEEVGVAVKPVVKKGVVDREEIERVVRLVIEGEEGKVMRRRARELKDSAVKVVEFGGLSYESLSQVVKQWKTG